MDGGISVSPRVIHVLNLIQRLEPQERTQLGHLLPPEVTSAAVVADQVLAEAIASVREKRGPCATAPSLDDPFIAGLTYREYFALPEDEAAALWEALAAEAPALEELPVIEAWPDAHLPARQERGP